MQVTLNVIDTVKGLFRISRKEGVVLFGKSARKKRILPPRSHRKILLPPSESLSKMGTPQGARSFSGQHWRIAGKGHPGRQGELCERDILLCTVSFLCV